MQHVTCAWSVLGDVIGMMRCPVIEHARIHDSTTAGTTVHTAVLYVMHLALD
jgi:hypothetical protein